MFKGMKRHFVVSFVVASLFAVACEKQPTPSADSPTPASSPTATPTAASTPETPMPTPEASASPVNSPTASSYSATTEPDGRPKLSSQSANEYLQSYDAYIRDFKSAYTAMKQGDVSKYQSVIRGALDLQTKSEKLGGELNPEEEKRFADYLQKKENELAEFATQNR